MRPFHELWPRALHTRNFAGDRLISPLAAQVLEQYPWPENITELRSVIERAGQLAGDSPIDVVHLLDRIQSAPEQTMHSPARLPPEGINLEQLEQVRIRQALERARQQKQGG